MLVYFFKSTKWLKLVNTLVSTSCVTNLTAPQTSLEQLLSLEASLSFLTIHCYLFCFSSLILKEFFDAVRTDFKIKPQNPFKSIQIGKA